MTLSERPGLPRAYSAREGRRTRQDLQCPGCKAHYSGEDDAASTGFWFDEAQRTGAEKAAGSHSSLFSQALPLAWRGHATFARQGRDREAALLSWSGKKSSNVSAK